MKILAPYTRSLSSCALILLMSTMVLLVPLPGCAQERLVPCGTRGGPECTICHLLELAQRVLRFVITRVAFLVTAAMLVYGGFLMIVPAFGGEKSLGQQQRGKTVIFNALIGIAIVFFAWLAIDTLIKVLGGKIVAGRSAGNISTGRGFGPWNAIQCTVKDAPPPPWAVACKTPGQKQDVDGFDVCAPGFQQFVQQATADGKGGASVRANRAGGTCSPEIAKRLDEDKQLIIALADQYKVDPAVIQAMGIQESHWNKQVPPTREKDGSYAYGPMQIRMDTACTIHQSFCSGETPDNIKRLQEPKNNFEIATRYYARLKQKYGNDRLAIAAYNGGWNTPSQVCATGRAWECKWDRDKNGNLVENTGFKHLRETHMPNVLNNLALIREGKCK
ncbi:MAG: hypothetical protein G01um101466_116 [Parcubacteria group bacterium Gr01-1014_66]|nr:MAG: hypothetical protein G01um101466_116 [Parcubacteria group bacterium Gr01-1014_66]